MPVDTHDDIVPATGVVNPNGVETHEDIRLAAGVEPAGERSAKAFGGGITPIELGNHDLDDEARRLILWSYAAAPVVRPLSREDGGRIYPVAMPTEIKEDLKAGKAKLKHLSPQEFLNESDPLHIGKGDRHIINSFERHIKSGDHLGPLKLYEHGHQDGRHRANAAKELGIKSVPVIDYRKADGGPVDAAQNAVDVARNLTPMGFYSAAAEAASKIPQRAPIDQIINKVKGSPNVKAEELDWSGVRNAFAGQKSVDPAQVAQHLQANLPQIQETVYREDDPKSALARWGGGENLVTPGHANYREVLMHTPTQAPPPETEYLVTGAFPMKFGSKEEANDYIDKMIKLREEMPALAPKIDKFPMHIIAQDKPRQKEEEDFHASHWPGVPNVLAHLRLSDRGMHSFGYPETLHIEELQSDWGQKGREEGFQGDPGKEPDEGLPKGPHVTTTEGWTDLALKRALREAAQGKYKKLTWTPGEEQADRYGLDKKFNQIHYSPDTNHLVAKGSGSYDDIDETVSPDALPGFLGKDLAAKLLDRPVTLNPHPDVNGEKVQSLIGGEIKVPQKGMRDFYDRMIPNRLQKLVSKLDPEAKVQLYGHKIWVPGRYDEDIGDYQDSDYQKVHSLEITPKLRAAILKGLPAYEHGGSVLKRAFKVISEYS